MSTSAPERIAAYFGADVDVDPLASNFNVAPTDDVYAVVATATADTPPALRAFQWGLLPVWARDRKLASKLINARAETLVEKPAFKGVFRKHRCIIPMDGFYEWSAAQPGDPLTKAGKPAMRAHFIRRIDGEPLAVAGLWSPWRDRAAGPREPWLHTVAVVTTSANATMSPLHSRMPVLLPKAMWHLWLDPGNDNIEMLQQLLVPAPDDLLTVHRVAHDVNNVRNNGPHLILATSPGSTDPAA